ncbi:uncharacterized protein F5147DRAFT_781841 [Suillus discolor]|uniref:KOW domain-containing protein n=1 Tax=Suillus discolor TaxID=1912936 RepID=A0A9P7ER18_9AGAM|nr:uncharacterized protein F5147DRAFT_781841 [Suillus discolor]KAG2085882.1 hypothetical protein F5147DRAFT_781841 [Suillus discolor]
MAKCMPSSDDEPAPKHVKNNERNCWAIPSPWEDVNAWRILEHFLTTNITSPKWKMHFYPTSAINTHRTIGRTSEQHCSLVTAMTPLPCTTSMEKDSPVAMSASRKGIRGTKGSQSCRTSNFKRFINDEAGDSEDNEDEDEDDEGEGEVRDGSSVQSHSITYLLGPSAKHTLAAAIDSIFNKDENTPAKAAWSPGTIENRMYLLVVHRTATHYITGCLRDKGFPVIVSAWLPGQLYVVSDSPRMIAASLPPSHSLSVKEYLRILEEEHEAVERSSIKLPSPSWVRIRHGKYKGDIGYVFDPDQLNHFVTVLIPPREFPYDMPQGSVALLNQSRLPNDNTVSDILRDGDINWSPTLTLMKSDLFSMQFLHKGDSVKVIKGEVRSEIGTVVSTHHASGTACLEINFDGHRQEMHVRLQDIEHVFWVGDPVQVVVGSHLGLEGHIIQATRDIFDVCQEVSLEVIAVPRNTHINLDHPEPLQ